MRIFLSIILLSVIFSCKENEQASKVKGEWSKLLNLETEPAPIVQLDENAHVNDSFTSAASTISPAEKPAQISAPERKYNRSGKIREDLVGFANQFMGTPYVYAESDPQVGFDCSGFINYVYRNFKFNVPRTTKDFENFGMNVEIDKVRKGDLLIFTGTEPNSMEVGHIGIVMNPKGMQSDFIHSSSGKANGVTVSSLGSEHYTKRFVKAISVID